MSEQLFNSIYASTNASVDPAMLFLSLGSSLVLGVILAKVYQYKTVYTKEFVITLAVLPTIISMIIFLVNGNLGTSVAVAGTFSLIRFRSASAGGKELLTIFVATAIGLATGMGFVALAFAFTLLLSAILLLFENLSFTSVNQSRRYIDINISADFDYEALFENIFTANCKSVELSTIQLENRTLKLNYVIDLDNGVRDHQLLQQFLKQEEVMGMTISTVAKKKKTL